MQATKPSLQNDLSYYRRLMNNLSHLNQPSVGEGTDKVSEVNSEDVELAALWLAKPCSMISSLSSLSGAFICKMSDICAERLRDIPKNEMESISRWLRIWTACVILFDRNTPAPGAFTKNSPVKVTCRI